MEYMLRIEKIEPNPAYRPESIPECYGYGRDSRTPHEKEQFLSRRVYEMTLTETEFQALRRATLEVM